MMLSITHNSTINFKTILFTLLLLLFFSGCAVQKPPSDFLFVTLENKDTFESLAQKHLGNSSMAWKIQESNNVSTITPGDELIIPLKNINPGGLTSNGFQLIPTLSYHSFTSSRSKNLLSISAKNFEEQLTYLKKHNFHTLTLDQLQDFLELGQVPQNSILITIDDGWISSYKVAYPILQNFKFNATLFIPTNYLNDKNKNIISWDQAREMVNDKSINIQCHTKGHQDLNLINDGQSLQSYITSIEDQVTSSKKIITKEIGKPVTSLAYPYGNTNPVAIEILKQNKYNMAFTVKRAGNSFFTPNYLLNRSMIYNKHDIKQFMENISVFEEFSIAEPEPIDNITDIRKLSYLNASEYEEKQQWRTALLAWKIQKDWLLTHQDIPNKGIFTSRKDMLETAEKKISELNIKIKNIAQKHYLIATKSTDDNEIQKQLLKALLYNPKHHDALAMLKNVPLEKLQTRYKVKNSETFKTISKNVYNKKDNSMIIPLFNSSIKDESDLVPGIELVLPTASAIKIIKNANQKKCNIRLTKPSSQMAKDLYAKANVLFSQDKIKEAINQLKKAVCLNPNYESAKEMLDLLKDV